MDGKVLGSLAGIRDGMLCEMAQDGFLRKTGGPVCYDPSPRDINNGECAEYAKRVVARNEGAEAFQVDEIPGWEHIPLHVVSKIDGRWYDAECVRGVDRLEDLPFIMRAEGRGGDCPAEGELE